MATHPVAMFAAAIRAQWFAAMSGGFSVPFAALAVFSDSAKGQIIWGSLAATAVFYSAYRFWRTEHERAEAAEAKLQPKLKLTQLKGTKNGLLYSYDVEIQNVGAEHIEHCLVKIEGLDITDGKAVSSRLPLVLMTRERSLRDDDQSCRFNLSPGEKKIIKLMNQENVAREICIIHERGETRLSNVRKCTLHLVAYGSAAPANAYVDAWIDLNAESRLNTTLRDTKP